MKTLIVDKLERCEKLWNEFSPGASVWDLWKVARSLYDPDIHRPYFIRLEEKNASGLLPLWYDSREQYYCLFGGGYPENMTFWFPPELFPLFYEAMPEPCALIDMNGEAVARIVDVFPEHKDRFRQEDLSYSLDLAKIAYDPERHLSAFSPKHRKNLKYDLKKLARDGYRVTWDNGSSSINKLIELNRGRFGDKSDLGGPGMAREFQSLSDTLRREGMLTASVISLEKKIVGVEAGIFFKNVYYLLNGGFDVSHENVGKLMIMEHIKKASALRAQKMDFLVGDTGWKKLWKLENYPVFSLEKGM